MRHLLLALALSLAACGGPPDTETWGQISQAVQLCPTSVVEGIDVYDGQGTISWHPVADAGRAFAFIKASQGDYNTQTLFSGYWAGSQDAGVMRSPYHFFDPTIDGIAQAQHFLSVLSANGGLVPGDLPPMLDLECPTSSTQSQASANCEYTGNSGWVPTSTLRQRVYDWLVTVEQATGRAPLIYSYPSWFADVGFTDPMLAQYPLYIATIGGCASVPAPWTTAAFWQYSWNGSVPGISGPVDMDRFIGTEQQLIAFATESIPDAGVDAGPSPDAGTTGTTDAGSAAPDAGTHAQGGCGCQSGPPAGTWLLGGCLAFLLSGPRKRRARSSSGRR